MTAPYAASSSTTITTTKPTHPRLHISRKLLARHLLSEDLCFLSFNRATSLVGHASPPTTALERQALPFHLLETANDDELRTEDTGVQSTSNRWDVGDVKLLVNGFVRVTWGPGTMYCLVAVQYQNSADHSTAQRESQ